MHRTPNINKIYKISYVCWPNWFIWLELVHLTNQLSTNTQSVHEKFDPFAALSLTFNRENIYLRLYLLMEYASHLLFLFSLKYVHCIWWSKWSFMVGNILMMCLTYLFAPLLSPKEIKRNRCCVDETIKCRIPLTSMAFNSYLIIVKFI